MAFLLHSYPAAKLTISSCFKQIPQRASSLNPVPARDTVIDFGKYKGKMMGSLSSSYLKWVSKNLRAQDHEQWAKLADQVLEDPIYKDRIEWEFAENVLTGNKASGGRLSSDGGATSALVEISERFNWDYDDKTGWSKVNFQLLGTTRGGRIPRKKGIEEAKEEEIDGGGGSADGGDRRRRRRERVRLRLMLRRREEGNEVIIPGEREDNPPGVNDGKTTGILNGFPGREALLKKVRDGR